MPGVVVKVLGQEIFRRLSDYPKTDVKCQEKRGSVVCFCFELSIGSRLHCDVSSVFLAEPFRVGDLFRRHL